MSGDRERALQQAMCAAVGGWCAGVSASLVLHAALDGRALVAVVIAHICVAQLVLTLREIARLASGASSS